MTRKLDSTGRIILSPTGHRTCCCATKPCLDDEPGVYYVGLLPCGGGVYSGCDDIGTTTVPCIIVDKRLLDTPGANVYNIYGICYTAVFGATTDKSKCEVVEWTDGIPCTPIVFRYTEGAPTFPVVGAGCSAVECTPANVAWVVTGCNGEELPLEEGNRRVYCMDGSCAECVYLAYPTAIGVTDLVTDLRGTSIAASTCCNDCLEDCASSTEFSNCCCGRIDPGTGDLLDCTYSYDVFWSDLTEFSDGSWTLTEASGSGSGAAIVGTSSWEVESTFSTSAPSSSTSSSTVSLIFNCDSPPIGLDLYGGFIKAIADLGLDGTVTESCYSYVATCNQVTGDEFSTTTKIGTVTATLFCNPQSPCVRTCSGTGESYIGDYL
jgi:hypothetical protein